MAEKKYISLAKLTQYDEKIKTKIAADDATTLAGAKSYADSLATNYDAAGAAATAETNAKAYADGKDAAITAAKSAADAAQADVDALEAKVGTVAEGNTVVGLVDAAKAAADDAQADVDALETKVGTIPTASTATDVIGYIDEKTSGIATDAALSQLQSDVDAAEAAIDAIEADYLKAEDKTALQAGIDAVDDRVDTLVGSDANKSVRKIANEELAAQLIPENAKESLDTLTEIAAWIQAHPDDASAMNAAIEALEDLVGTLPEDATQSDIVSYVQALVNTEKTRAEAAEAGLGGRLDTIEAKFGSGDGSVEDMIADAKAEAISTAAADATSKANQSLTDAKAYADAEDAKIETRVDALETASAGHASATDLTALATRVSTAEGEIDTLQSDVDAVEALAAANKAAHEANAAAIALKASQTALDDEITRAKAAEEANAAAIAEFVEVSEEEINALFE